jgi:hypothetical protein
VTRNAINTSEKSAIAITATTGQQPIEGGSRGGASSILTFWGSSSARSWAQMPRFAPTKTIAVLNPLPIWLSNRNYRRSPAALNGRVRRGSSMISRRPVLLSTSRRTGTGKYPLKSKVPAVFKFVLTFLAIAAGTAKRLPRFRPASIERELE